jgi:hypothetical protein
MTFNSEKLGTSRCHLGTVKLLEALIDALLGTIT